MKNVLGVIFGIIALISMALFFILPGWYVAGAIFAVIVIISTIINSLKKKHETKCSKCKKSYDYDSEVEWRLIRSWTKGGAENSNTLVRSYFQYDITCTCSDCGTVKRYRKKIEGPSVNSKLEVKAVDPEYVLEQNFDQTKEATWGAIFLCILMSVAFIFGGLFFSGKLGAMLADADIYIPGVTQIEKGEDPADYYGTYYTMNGQGICSYNITESGCTVTVDNGTEKETNVYDYEYVSAEWAEIHLASPNYSGKDAILIYQDESKTQCRPLWIVENIDGEYKFCDNTGAEYSTTVISWDEYKNDPKDYYGTYYTSQNGIYLVTVEITEDEIKVTYDRGVDSLVEIGTYDYFSEKYVEKFYPSYSLEGWDALFIYEGESKDQFSIFWIAKQDGKYSITFDDKSVATTDVITFADMMGDTKDYYGKYRLDSFYVVLDEDGTAKINLGNGDEVLSYSYVNKEYLTRFYGENYDAAIVAYRDDGNAYIFEYESGKLTLADQYIFEK